MTMKKLIERIDSIERKQTTTLTEGLEQSVAEGSKRPNFGAGIGDIHIVYMDGKHKRKFKREDDAIDYADDLYSRTGNETIEVQNSEGGVVYSFLDEQQSVAEGRGSKPDYIDLDGDGNRKETMKKAAADKKKSTVKESWTDFDDAKRAHEKAGSTVTGRPNDYTVTMADGTRKRFITKDDRRKIETLPPVAARRDDDEDEAPAKKATKAAPPKEGGKKRGRPAGSKNKRKVNEMNESEFHQFMRGVMLIEERMSPEQKAEKERIVEGMKKSAKDLKSRYGSRWQDVMHATATKKAMESVGSKKK